MKPLAQPIVSVAPEKRGGGRTPVLAHLAVLISAIAVMIPGVWGNSVTVVEVAHLPAGLAAWQHGNFGVYRVCGPFSKLLYALPAHLAGVQVGRPPDEGEDLLTRHEWMLGVRFQEQNIDNYWQLYQFTRLLPVTVMLLGGCLIAEWSTRLFGRWPGVVSLCLWCWAPPVLAHASLVTSDMLSAVTVVLAARCFWAFLIRPGVTAAVVAGVSLGLAAATKFTLLVLYPCWAFLLIGRILQLYFLESPAPSGRRKPQLHLLVLGTIGMAASIVVIDGLYFFQGIGFRLSEWTLGRSWLFETVRRARDYRAAAWLLDIPLPIPLEFLRGLDFQLWDTDRLQDAYLLGQTLLGGWWYWYAVAFFLKVPLPAITLFVLAVARTRGPLCGDGGGLWAALCVLLPSTQMAMVISATTGTGTNAAFRYLLPSVALLCVWGGRACVGPTRRGLALATCLLAWLAQGAISSAPDQIGWCNELGRIASRSSPAMLGDSLDWGQDLYRLSNWVAKHSESGSTLVCAYGLGSTAPYGLRPPSGLPLSGPREGAAYIAVSADVLFGYEAKQCVKVSGSPVTLTSTQRKVLRSHAPWARVGNTVWIYRLRDLTPGLPESSVDAL